LGSQAVFGRTKGHIDYTDPASKYIFRGAEVDQGPESAALEQIQLPFWYGDDQYVDLEAGFGPYALSRLASFTGGIYFITRFESRRTGFDPARMREYAPDWVSRREYEQLVAGSLCKQAVSKAAEITHQQQLPGMPSLIFPEADSEQFKESMSVNQGIAEVTRITVEDALREIITVGEQRDRERSRRWQAQYDLIYGRLLAMKVRCLEYNSACARMKTYPQKFSSPKFNAWQLVADQEIKYGDRAVVAARKAQTLLWHVVEDYPATPWALLAQRELRDPFGFKWVEAYVPPQLRNKDNEAANRKIRNINESKPPALPKL
jgi:hypothetical protein